MRFLIRAIFLCYLALQTFAVAAYAFFFLLFTVVDLAGLDFEQLRALNWLSFLFVMTAAATHFLLVRHTCLSLGWRTTSARPAIAAATINVLLAGYPLWETVLHQWDRATHLFYGGIFLANAMLLVAFTARPMHDYIFRPRPEAEDGEAATGD